MDVKCTMLDIASALVRRSNIPAADAASFVRLFFETIQDALLREKIVKVRGFGTFKLVSVESRESVSVADGRRIQIAGHTKVTFTPDSVLRDAVNKPFAEFDTAILSDSLDLAALEALDAAPDTDTETAEVLETADVSEAPEPSPAEVAVPASASEEPLPLEETAPPLEEETPHSLEETTRPLEEETPHSLEETSLSLEETSLPPVEEPAPLFSEDESEPLSPVTEVSSPSTSSSHRRESSGELLLTFFLCLLLFAVSYMIGYLRPVELPFFSDFVNEPPFVSFTSPPADTHEVPSTSAAASETRNSSAEPVAPSALGAGAAPASEGLSGVTQEAPSAASSEAPEVTSSGASSAASGSASSASGSTSSAPSETLAYPQLEGGDYWIVGIKATEIMKPGRTLLNFSLKYYKSKDFVPYICTMNNIKNPDVVPLDKELRIPELRKKHPASQE